MSTGRMSSPGDPANNVEQDGDAPGAPVSFRTAAARVIAPYLITRAAIFLVGFLSIQVVEKGQWYPKHPTLLKLFFNWDANWYGSIVLDGYDYFLDKPSKVAFFPLYPLLVKGLAWCMDWRLAGYLISNVALFIGATFLYRLVALDHEDRAVADRTVWYLLISPMSFFFSAFYTEGLFLCLVVLSFYFARRRSWLAAGVFGMLASATRTLGVLLVVPLALEYLQMRRGGLREALRRLRPDVLWLGLVPMGLVGYMVYLQNRFGDPFAFSKATAHWDRRFVFIGDTLRLGRRYEPFYQVLFYGAVVLAIAALVALVVRRTRASYVVFLALFLFMNLSSNHMEAIPRYISVLFPVYLGFAYLTDGSRSRDQVFVMGSMALLTVATVLFTNGYWLT